MNSPVATATADLMVAWAVFKKTHNLQDPKVQCCEHTRNLFVALELFNEAILGMTGEEPLGKD